ncbi:MAG: hypothetical protein DCC43_04505 [Candidatus Brocadia sp.]|nr:MAG: hypothetical protein DCC43_04505 [Candidatus Brocadia sp.]
MIQICFMKLGLRQSPQCRETSLVAPAAILKFLNIKLWVQVVNLNPRGDILVPCRGDWAGDCPPLAGD